MAAVHQHLDSSSMVSQCGWAQGPAAHACRPTRQLPVPWTIQPASCLCLAPSNPQAARAPAHAHRDRRVFVRKPFSPFSACTCGAQGEPTLREPSPEPYTWLCAAAPQTTPRMGSAAACCTRGDQCSTSALSPYSAATSHLDRCVLSRLAPGHLGHILAALQHLKQRKKGYVLGVD